MNYLTVYRCENWHIKICQLRYEFTDSSWITCSIPKIHKSEYILLPYMIYTSWCKMYNFKIFYLRKCYAFNVFFHANIFFRGIMITFLVSRIATISGYIGYATFLPTWIWYIEIKFKFYYLFIRIYMKCYSPVPYLYLYERDTYRRFLYYATAHLWWCTRIR